MIPCQHLAALDESIDDLQALHTWHDLFALVCGLLIAAQMLFSFNTYSGRARHQGPAS